VDIREGQSSQETFRNRARSWAPHHGKRGEWNAAHTSTQSGQEKHLTERKRGNSGRATVSRDERQTEIRQTGQKQTGELTGSATKKGSDGIFRGKERGREGTETCKQQNTGVRNSRALSHRHNGFRNMASLLGEKEKRKCRTTGEKNESKKWQSVPEVTLPAGSTRTRGETRRVWRSRVRLNKYTGRGKWYAPRNEGRNNGRGEHEKTLRWGAAKERDEEGGP